MDFENVADEMLRGLETLSRNTPHKLIGELSKGEIFLLGYLHSSGGSAGSHTLSEVMGTSSARIAAAVKSMESKGWVYRKSDQDDQRKTIVYVTSEGEGHVLEYRQHARQALKEMLEELGEVDTAEYLRITRRINEIANRMRFYDGRKDSGR